VNDRGVCLIVGGSRGIGKAVAIDAARAGYRIVLTYVGQHGRAQQVVTQIQGSGGAARAVQCDASCQKDVAALFALAAEEGPMSLMVFAGGVTGAASTLADASADTIARVIDVNLLGALLSAQAAVRAMAVSRGGQGGAIIFISSRAAAYGAAGEFVWYAASKGGIDSLAIGLSKEVASEGIRVNTVSPGPIDTEMHRPGRLDEGAQRAPMKRAGTPKEVAAAVLFLASDLASYTTGANLSVAGGL